MPIRPREINDQPTEARLREVIRSILNQEVRRLLNANAGLQTQVTTNTGDIAANVTNIAANVVEICNNERRTLMEIGAGIVTSKQLSTSGGGLTVTRTAFAGLQEWDLQIASHPIQVTLWSRQTFTANAQFDTFQFDAVQFDEAEEIQAIDTTATVTYVPSTMTFTIDWGSSKTGTLYLLNFGSGTAFGVVAVAD